MMIILILQGVGAPAPQTKASLKQTKKAPANKTAKRKLIFQPQLFHSSYV